MGLLLNGKSVEAQSKPIPAKPDAAATERIAIFMRLVALNLEARRELAEAVRRLRKLEGDLANPELRDHPRRPEATRRLPKREAEERDAVIKLAEANTQLARCWETIPPADKNKFALTTVIGADPEASIDMVLWTDDRGLALIVPFPEDWSVPHDIAHRAFDPEGPASRKSFYTRQELLTAEYAPF